MGTTTRNLSEKHYNTDWAKAKVHVLLGKMLDDTLLKFKKPRDIKVLHFAGIDAQETRSVYLRRGIPAENIVALERDPAIARKIEEHRLGIRVINDTLESHIKERTKNGAQLDYNVISLDFTGPITTGTAMLFHDLYRFSSPNNILFHSANLIKRDPKSAGEYFKAVRTVNYKNLSPNEIRENYNKHGFITKPGSIYRDLAKFKDGYKESESRPELKRQIYPYVVRSSFGGISNADYFTLIRFLHPDNFDHIEKMIINSYKEFFKDSAKEVSSLRELFEDSYSHHPIFANYLESNVYRTFKYRLEAQGITEEKVLLCLSTCLYNLAEGSSSFSQRANSNYTYISESGSPMVGSIFLFSRSRYLNDALKEVGMSMGYPDGFHIEDSDRFRRAHDNYYKQFIRQFSGIDLLAPYEITFMGNSSKPVFTKERFISELEKGLTIDEVKSKYRGWDGKPLSQWKAHYSMGTYGKASSIAIESSEESDVEKISKDDAIDLLSSGVPADEIYDAYPTSFSVGQLRAYKADLTMKTYQRKS